MSEPGVAAGLRAAPTRRQPVINRAPGWGTAGDSRNLRTATRLSKRVGTMGMLQTTNVGRCTSDRDAAQSSARIRPSTSLRSARPETEKPRALRRGGDHRPVALEHDRRLPREPSHGYTQGGRARAAPGRCRAGDSRRSYRFRPKHVPGNVVTSSAADGPSRSSGTTPAFRGREAMDAALHAS